MSLLKLTLPSYQVKVEVQMSSNVFIAAPVGLKGLEFYTESTGPKPVDDRSSGLVPFFSIQYLCQKKKRCSNVEFESHKYLSNLPSITHNTEEIHLLSVAQMKQF